MAALLRSRSAYTLLQSFRQHQSFPFTARTIATSQVAASPSKKADTLDTSNVAKTPKNPTKRRSKKPESESKSKVKDLESPKKKAPEPKLYSERPKGPITPVLLFFADKLQGPSPSRERLKDASAEWKTLSDADKETWVVRAKDVNAQREKELAVWESQLSPEALQQYKKDKLQRYRARAARRAKALGIEGLPQRAPSAYSLFVRAYYKDPASFNVSVSEKHPPTVMKALAGLWTSMTLGEKGPYIAESEELAKKHKDAVASRMAEKLKHPKDA